MVNKKKKKKKNKLQMMKNSLINQRKQLVQGFYYLIYACMQIRTLKNVIILCKLFSLSTLISNFKINLTSLELDFFFYIYIISFNLGVILIDLTKDPV